MNTTRREMGCWKGAQEQACVRWSRRILPWQRNTTIREAQNMRHTVLLVDDEPKVLSGLARILQNEPYEILKAGNSEEAAEVLRTAH
jgi:hypothetical protein